jgi:hypothetical protein
MNIPHPYLSVENIVNEAFVYCWTDHLTNKLYAGWHKGQPNDGYVCSSKLMLQEYKNRPKDFTRQVLAMGTCKDMTSFETVILRAENAKKNDFYYNLHNGDGLYSYGPMTKEHIEKLKGPKTEKHKVAMKLNHADVSGKNNPMYGRSGITEKNLKWYTDGTNEKYCTEGTQPNGWYRGRKIKGCKFPPRTQEHRNKLSDAAKNRLKTLKGHNYIKITCPHCNKIGGGGNMTRHHFDNCRYKNGSN